MSLAVVPGARRVPALVPAAVVSLLAVVLLALPPGATLGSAGDGVGLGGLGRTVGWISLAAVVMTLLAARASGRRLEARSFLLPVLGVALAVARMPVALVGLLLLAGFCVPSLAGTRGPGWQRALFVAAAASGAAVAGAVGGRQHGDELIAGLVITGFLAASGMVPFGWHMLRSLEAAPPEGVALVGATFLPGVVAGLVAAQPLLADLHEAQRAGLVLGWFGASTALLGALYAMGAADWRGLAVRTLAMDIGLAMVGVAAFDIRGLQAAALVLAVLGCTRPALLFADSLGPRRGAGLVVTALALLACAGLPPTLGFPARLLVISAAARVSTGLAVVVVAAMILEFAAIALVLRRRLAPGVASAGAAHPGVGAGAGRSLATLLGLALVGGGLFPGLLLRYGFNLAG